MSVEPAPRNGGKERSCAGQALAQPGPTQSKQALILEREGLAEQSELEACCTEPRSYFHRVRGKTRSSVCAPLPSPAQGSLAGRVQLGESARLRAASGAQAAARPHACTVSPEQAALLETIPTPGTEQGGTPGCGEAPDGASLHQSLPSLSLPPPLPSRQDQTLSQEALAPFQELRLRPDS